MPQSTEKPLKNVFSGCLHRVCYYPSWAHQYRAVEDDDNSGDSETVTRFLREYLNTSLCTHIHYAYAGISEANRLTPLQSNDVSCSHPSQGIYYRINQLKQTYKDLKTLITVGGRTLGSGPFTRMVSTPDSRQEFVDSCVQFLEDHGFDGLDLHWEYPGYGDSPPEDRERFTLLLQQLRKTFHKYNALTRPADSPLLLTAAVAPGPQQRIENAYEVEKIHGLVDYMSIMTFDLHGPWNNVTGHGSPLYSPDNHSINWAAEYYCTVRGVPRRKVLLGVATYGQNFTLLDPSNSSLGAPTVGSSDGVEEGTYEEGGVLAYYQICKRTGERKRSVKQGVPYLVDGRQWIGYDDVDSVGEKSEYVVARGYGGVVVWTPALDDFSGDTCGEGSFPLLTAATAVLCPNWTMLATPGDQGVNS
ncbi:chitotriosidase-1-like [Babylonia areolata]|uniref:chitotriosidase-1-like n=1 Tax=Babylonia areolata TaxID=304850 RepID=UPI003FD18279